MYRLYFDEYVRDLGVPWPELLALGRQDPDDRGRALQHGLARRARERVGQRRQPTARRGQPSPVRERLFPRWPESEVPVGHVTNGVHVPSWDSPWTDALWTRAAGKQRWRGEVSALAARHPPPVGRGHLGGACA